LVKVFVVLTWVVPLLLVGFYASFGLLVFEGFTITNVVVSLFMVFIVYMPLVLGVWFVIATCLTAIFGTSFYSAALAPVRWLGREARATARAVYDGTTYLARQRIWSLLQEIAFGLEGYRLGLPRPTQEPRFNGSVNYAIEKVYLYEDLPEAAKARALAKRDEWIKRAFGDVTKTLPQMASPDVRSLLKMVETDLSLVHAAYYTEDECIGRIADWISGKASGHPDGGGPQRSCVDREPQRAGHGQIDSWLTVWKAARGGLFLIIAGIVGYVFQVYITAPPAEVPWCEWNRRTKVSGRIDYIKRLRKSGLDPTPLNEWLIILQAQDKSNFCAAAAIKTAEQPSPGCDKGSEVIATGTVIRASAWNAVEDTILPILDSTKDRTNLICIEPKLKSKPPEPTDQAKCLNKGDAFSTEIATSACIRLTENLAIAYYNRGNAYVETEKYDEAIADYGKAIELDPKYEAATAAPSNARRRL
jgi:tetratricopeptide (TPR) repeat protein